MNTISFPNLGIEFSVNPVAFTVFGRGIYWYALIILAGFAIALAIAVTSAKKRGINPDNMVDIGIIGLIAGILGARAYYVIFAWDEFKEYPINIFRIWSGGLAIYGGLIAAVIATAIYCRVKRVNFRAVADLCAPSLLVAQAVGRFGNLINCEVYGRATESLFAMSVNGSVTTVHPLFLYESAWNLLGFIIIMLTRDKKKADGQVFCGYIAWYAFGRFFLEGMRDTQYILYVGNTSVAVSQLLSAVLVVAAVVGMIVLQKRFKNVSAAVVAEGGDSKAGDVAVAEVETIAADADAEVAAVEADVDAEVEADEFEAAAEISEDESKDAEDN